MNAKYSIIYLGSLLYCGMTFDDAMAQVERMQTEDANMASLHASIDGSAEDAFAIPCGNRYGYSIVPEPMRLKVLRVEAWREGEGGWTWNNWFHVGDIDAGAFEAIADNPRKLLAWMRSGEGPWMDHAYAGRVGVHDDGYNVEIYLRATGEPIAAIEYGPLYN